MKLAGLIPCSLVDYPGQAAVVAFTQGCNWRCPYCHNAELLSLEAPSKEPLEGLLALLEARPERARNLVITGGEPTQQPDLLEFLRFIRPKVKLLKLDTNGSHPAVLKQILEAKLVDYVAVDFKASPERYDEAVGRPVDDAALKQTVKLLIDSGLDHEFRTTVTPRLHRVADFTAIGQALVGAQHLYLQPFQPAKALNTRWRDDVVPSPQFLKDCAAQAAEWLPVTIRN